MAERMVRIRFTGDAKGIRISSKEAETAIDRLQDSVQRGFGGMIKASAAFASKMGSAVAAVQAASGAAAGLATASGALLALPAGAAAYAVVLGAVKLGAEGAERAMERFTERTAGVREAVSASFEKALIPAVDGAASLVTNLQRPMQRIVTQIGGMAQEAVRVARVPENFNVLNRVANATSVIMRNLKAAVAPLVQAFIDVVSVAEPGLWSIGEGAGDAAQRFADWIREMKESGELAERMQAGFEAIGSFVAMLVDAGQIVVGIFKGISAGAGGVGGVMGPVLDQINRFVNSVEGQAMLRELGAAMAAVGRSVSAVLDPALRALGPLIGPLSTLFSQFVTVLSEMLVPIIEFLAPGLAAIAGWIKQNTEWLAPLIAAVVTFTAVTWLLNAALMANPIMLIIGFIALLITAFASLWRKSEGFRNFFIAAWALIKNRVHSVVDWIVGKWQWLMSFFQAVPAAFRALGRDMGEGIKSGFKSAVNFLIDMLNGLINGLNILINGINLVNPFSDIPRIPHVPKLARGGTLLRGGMVEVGERGREMVHLPAGAQVSSKTDSDAMIAAAGGGDVHVYLGDEPVRGIVRRVVREELRAGVRRAAMAPGGAW